MTQKCLVCQVDKDILEFYNIGDDDDTYYSVCTNCRANGHKGVPEHVDYKPKDFVGVRRAALLSKERGRWNGSGSY